MINCSTFTVNTANQVFGKLFLMALSGKKNKEKCETTTEKENSDKRLI